MCDVPNLHRAARILPPRQNGERRPAPSNVMYEHRLDDDNQVDRLSAAGFCNSMVQHEILGRDAAILYCIRVSLSFILMLLTMWN